MQKKPSFYREKKTNHVLSTKTGTTSEESRSTPPTQNPRAASKQSHRNTSSIKRCSTKNRPRGCHTIPYGTMRSNSSRTHQQPCQEGSSHSHRKNTKKCTNSWPNT